MITKEHAKALIRTSAQIMVREPDKHGYAEGYVVPYVAVKNGRSCFCLFGGAAALLIQERGETYTIAESIRFSLHGPYSKFWTALLDLEHALGFLGSHKLIDAHDTTADVNEMYRKVEKILGEI